jgi:hypothetical protein
VSRLAPDLAARTPEDFNRVAFLAVVILPEVRPIEARRAPLTVEESVPDGQVRAVHTWGCQLMPVTACRRVELARRELALPE